MFSSIWAKAMVGVFTAAVLASAGAAGNTFLNSSRVTAVETQVVALDMRQRSLTTDMATLKSDVGYTRRAVDALLDERGLPRPQ